MWKLTLLALISAAFAVASPLEKRQAKGLPDLFGNLAGKLVSNLKASKVEILKPTISGDGVKRVRLTYGPFKIKPANSKQREGNFFSLDPQGTSYVGLATDFPNDITILNGNLNITLADGHEISNSRGVYNHHVFVIDGSKGLESSIACAAKGKSGRPISIPAFNSILGNSAESMGDSARGNVDPTNKLKMGNFVGKGHKAIIQLDLVNYNNKTEEVYISADLSYVDGKAKGVWQQEVYLIPIGACESKYFGLDSLFLRPPQGKKRWTLKGGGLTMQDEGKLMYVRGHMHDGGVNMVFKLNGQEICDSRTKYNAAAVGSSAQSGAQSGAHGHGGMDMGMGMGMDDGMMGGVSACANGTVVKKGDTISVEAFYDTEKHPLREHPSGGMSEAMALAVFILGKQIK